jgi:ABC-type amino acid transport system permease subunit
VNKYIVVREVNWLGGKNPWIFFVYLITGVVLLIMTFIMLVVNNKLEKELKTH